MKNFPVMPPPLTSFKMLEQLEWLLWDDLKEMKLQVSRQVNFHEDIAKLVCHPVNTPQKIVLECRLRKMPRESGGEAFEIDCRDAHMEPVKKDLIVIQNKQHFERSIKNLASFLRDYLRDAS